MKNAIKLYWMIGEKVQRRTQVAISILGVIVSQVLLVFGINEHNVTDYRAVCYIAYFLFLMMLVTYNFMAMKSKNSMSTFLLQVRDIKSFYVKGIIVNNIMFMLLYYAMSMLVMLMLIPWNGFHFEIVIISSWAVLIATIWCTYANFAQINGKTILGMIITGIYISVFFISSIFLNITSENSAILHYVTQPSSLIAMVPFVLCSFLGAYGFGIYCYKTRREHKIRVLRK